MTTDQIITVLNGLGEAGGATIKNGNELYTRRDENADWMYLGTVGNVETAQQNIDFYSALKESGGPA